MKKYRYVVQKKLQILIEKCTHFKGSQYWILSFFFPQISQRKTSTRVQFIVRFTLNKKKH